MPKPDAQQVPETAIPYANGRAHLEEELERLRLLIRLEGAEDPAMPRRADAQAERLRERVALTQSAGIFLPVAHLAQTFRLSRLELDLLLLALAPLLDAEVAAHLARLHGDPRRTYPTPELACRLLGPLAGQPAEILEAFHPEAPLRRGALISIDTDRPVLGSDLHLRPYFADLAVLHFAIGSERGAPDAFGLELVEPRRADEAPLASEATQRIARLGEQLKREAAEEPCSLVHLSGPAAEESLPAVASMLARFGLRLFSVDSAALLARHEQHPIRGLLRSLSLANGVLAVRSSDPGHTDSSWGALGPLVTEVAEATPVMFLLSEKPLGAAQRRSLGNAVRHRIIEIPLPSRAERAQALGLQLRALGATCVAGVDLEEIAEDLALTHRQLQEAAQAALERAQARAPDAEVTRADLIASGLAQTEHRLGDLARKIEPGYGWADVVLPEASLEQLRSVCAQRRNRRQVLERWGFERKVRYGRGTHVLFSGPPGTGKTMVARIIAGELGLPLYAIELSAVVSKYIGETEKNLSQVFDEAERARAILFFDEADALFAKRTEVKGANDRYANLETGYLLQRMEQYEGLTILATNLRDNLDAAFARRLSFIIDFPFPDAASRRDILTKLVPAEVPVAPDVDWGYLAEKLELSGGGLRNVVLDAAFLAAERGTAIQMRDLLSATRREYGKLGRAFIASDFPTYRHLLEG